MGWIKQELQDRASARRAQENPAEQQAEQAARQRWSELAAQLEADVDEYNQHGGSAAFTQPSGDECRVENDDTGLVLRLRADFDAQNIQYSFESTGTRVAPPEGGIFSLRRSRWGRVELYSSDQRVNSEAARRLLLEPILFPTESAA
jgi:hypothetical protein